MHNKLSTENTMDKSIYSTDKSSKHTIRATELFYPNRSLKNDELHPV